MNDANIQNISFAGFRIYNITLAQFGNWSLIENLLPEQGCIEVQRDEAGKEHFWHKHDTDETLVILDGQVRFYWEEGEEICGPGTVISLPAHMRHGSVALEGGSTYLISFHNVNLGHHD